MFQNSPLDPQDFMQRMADDLMDSYDEELEQEIDYRYIDENGERPLVDSAARRDYFKNLFHLQGELVKLQDWVQQSREKIVIIFEGRDAAGKGGVIRRLTERVSPRVFRVNALPVPSDREKSQMYM